MQLARESTECSRHRRKVHCVEDDVWLQLANWEGTQARSSFEFRFPNHTTQSIFDSGETSSELVEQRKNIDAIGDQIR